jgi:SUMO ligase MMS21 Smc5/6 complex component
VQKTIPDNSPVLIVPLACAGCSRPMEMKIVKGRRGLDHVEYTCVNPEVGCSYKIEVKTYVNAEMKGFRPEVAEVVKA